MKRSLENMHRRLLARADALRTPLSRRAMLGGLSAAALGITLPVWRSLEASAQLGGQKRLFVFFTPNGTVPDMFFPAVGPQFTLSPILTPLEAFKEKLLVLKGVHMESTIGETKPGGPHMKGPGAMLTGGWLLEGSFTGAGGPAGYANNISVDQVVAGHIGQDTAYPSLEFGIAVEGQEPLRIISYRGSNQPNPTVDDPWVMFDRVFSGFTPGDTGAEQLAAERASVLDYVKGELAVLEPRLPAEDRPRLQAHAEAVRNIERQLQALGQQCELPVLPGAVDVRAKENYPLVGRLQMDLMFQAQACDLTRVSSFMWSNADSWQYFPWIGVDEEHHALSHLPDELARDKLIKIDTWYAEQIAYFLALLANVPEGEGTMLDNSLVLWGNEIGEGSTHTHQDIPWVLAGSAGGHFSTGRLIEYDAQPHNNLLLSVLHAFGLESETTFGAPEYCTGPLAGLRA